MNIAPHMMLAAISVSEIMGFIAPLVCMWGFYEGVSMIWKGRQSHDKGERVSETFWGLVYALAPLIITIVMERAGMVTLPLDVGLPF